MTQVEDVIAVLHGLIEKIEEDPEYIEFALNIKIHHPVTAESLLKQDEALRHGQVYEVPSMTSIDVKFDGSSV